MCDNSFTSCAMFFSPAANLHLFLIWPGCDYPQQREHNPDNVFLNVQDYFELTRATHTQVVCRISQVIDAVADSKDTMMSVIDVLRTRKIIEGDAKIYDVLKSEYGDDLSWLIPYPGTC